MEKAPPKILTFSKGEAKYCLRYGDVKELIECLVDLADDPKHPIDLLDVFQVVHHLAYQNAQPAAIAAP